MTQWSLLRSLGGHLDLLDRNKGLGWNFWRICNRLHIKSSVFSSQNSCRIFPLDCYSSVKGSCWGSSDCDFRILESKKDLKMPYKNMGPTISKPIENMTTDNSDLDKPASDQPVPDHIKQVLMVALHEISWIKYKMPINPTTTVQIILIARFHFLIDMPQKLLNSKETRVVLVEMRIKLKIPSWRIPVPKFVAFIRPSNNTIFMIPLKHNSTMAETFAYLNISSQHHTFVFIVIYISCQCQLWIVSAELENWNPIKEKVCQIAFCN